MRRFVAALLLTIVLLSGCGSAGDGKETKDYLGGTEHLEAKEIFKNNRCITCHATDLRGTAGLNSNLQQVGSRLTKEEIIEVITNGRRTMPAQKDNLTAEQIELLADWLVELK